MRALLLLGVFALAGCMAPPPEAVVYATATYEIEGEWEAEIARVAMRELGYELDASGPAGVFTKVRNGIKVETQAPRADQQPAILRFSFRFDNADVCSASTYDEWVERLIDRLQPMIASQRSTFEAKTGWATTPTTAPWDITAADRDGTLLQFPDHCGASLICVDSEGCEPGSRWQSGPQRYDAESISPA